MARPKKYAPTHKFIRNCPECNIQIEYKHSSQYFQAERLNRKCRKCGCGHFRGKTKHTSNVLKKIGKKNSVLRKGKSTWNKGLTKDQHPSLVTIGEKRKGKKHTDETLKKIGNASKNHWKNKKYRNLVSTKIKEVRGLPEVVSRWRQTGETNGKFTPLEQKSEWEQYQHLVWYYTNKNDLSLLEGYKRRGRVDINKNAYHLDHIVSITDGFVNEIQPEIIGSFHNLRFISAVENMKKKQRSDMTIEKLKKMYEETHDTITR